MLIKIFLFVVLLLQAVPCINVKASNVCSDSFTFRDVYQKPAFMAALDWLQTLEDERDKADMVGNFDVFKRTTDEISATIVTQTESNDSSAQLRANKIPDILTIPVTPRSYVKRNISCRNSSFDFICSL